ncbi:hypothetical protein QFZ27_006921 [Inquilinus ginsengisoli]|uniref:hypothetical protein n=1 Tax=Inquilinus ginsengisoli TaxID=363840 RepID=UPI003D24A429
MLRRVESHARNVRDALGDRGAGMADGILDQDPHRPREAGQVPAEQSRQVDESKMLTTQVDSARRHRAIAGSKGWRFIA